MTSYALRRRQEAGGGDDFLERFQELTLFGGGGFPPGHPFAAIRVMPSDVNLPPIWLLGSSDYSAELAAAVGSGFAFAHHFASHDARAAMRSYREHFRPSQQRQGPYAILAVHVVCADTDEEAERLAATVDLNYVLRSKGEYRPLASPEEAAAYPYSAADRERIRLNRGRVFVGAPGTVTQRLDALVRETGADEVMVTTMVFDHAARRRSYALLAEAFGLVPQAAAAGGATAET